MGILKRNVSAKSERSAITIIAEGNKFSGEMSIVGKMHVDGIFDGTISSMDYISIGKSGHISGVTRARQIIVSGILEGEVYCDELHVEAGGRVRATVVSKEMSISPKGCFEGERRVKDVMALPDLIEN
ncbi:bactofilin family protein [Marinobacterium jannaschii]|uniref:bactofilin family protein n=1 Tax=Marinobacterium jannaschii TaxID=64970 RepID=UPI000A06B11C|nr:polymer-forming cytoskeletal protein [Marinobacterium jannaschii]